jgi:hypothetical protein
MSVPVSLRAECASNAADLAAMRACYRPLLLFAPHADDGELARQLDELGKHAEDLRERDVPVVVILEDGQEFPAERLKGLPMARWSGDERSRVREQFATGRYPFSVVLIGKDGGEKLRVHALLPVAKLKSAIDAMPMRQAEMARRK